MGFLDSLLKGEEEKTEDYGRSSGMPFKISLGFLPLRLAAMKDNKVNLTVRLTNTSGEPQLVSVDATLPRGPLLGFDPTCIHKTTEKKLGNLRPNETIEVVLPVWANNQTKEGNYPIEVTAYSHYLDYTKVINSMKKSISLRVV